MKGTHEVKEKIPPYTMIPLDTKDKYLGIWPDRRLTWRHHVLQKRLDPNNRLKLLYPLVHHNSKLPLKQKILLYYNLFRPMWTCGIQIFGAASKSNLRTIHAFPSKFLRLITGPPYYLSNRILHKDLNNLSLISPNNFTPNIYNT